MVRYTGGNVYNGDVRGNMLSVWPDNTSIKVNSSNRV